MDRVFQEKPIEIYYAISLDSARFKGQHCRGELESKLEAEDRGFDCRQIPRALLS
ncbi:MAG: hypothetical protein JWN25_2264 [Verrucomicrobiales bacterium]|nr:hypothetical protein [Verrucomicrobiales bacterium]